ncbi:transporter [Thalassotalea agariperforans]
MSTFNKAALAVGFVLLSPNVFADQNHNTTLPETHAPIGVMGDHMHKAGEFMFSYRLMTMSMSGNLQGDNSISSDEIATTVSNPFASMPMMPPTVRVVPQKMSTNMHMLGFMYAPSDDITLMAMVNYLTKDMDLTTYQGMMGTNTLGDFTTKSSGFGDTKLGLLYRLFDNQTHHFHLNANWSIPTGSIDETDTALTPMNMQMSMRLPYGMQLGSGSNIIELGTTYNGYADRTNWGAQMLYSAAIDDNDENYQVGDKLNLTAWYAYRFADSYSASVRVNYLDQDAIDGMDKMIMAPVTTANPQNYGGERIDLALGLNTVIANQHRIAFEYVVPVDNKVNGVQMDMDNMFTVGYQLAF